MQPSQKRKKWFAILARLTICSVGIQYYYLGWRHIQKRSYFKINIVVVPVIRMPQQWNVTAVTPRHCTTATAVAPRRSRHSRRFSIFAAFLGPNLVPSFNTAIFDGQYDNTATVNFHSSRVIEYVVAAFFLFVCSPHSEPDGMSSAVDRHCDSGRSAAGQYHGSGLPSVLNHHWNKCF